MTYSILIIQTRFNARKKNVSVELQPQGTLDLINIISASQFE